MGQQQVTHRPRQSVASALFLSPVFITRDVLHIYVYHLWQSAADLRIFAQEKQWKEKKVANFSQ